MHLTKLLFLFSAVVVSVAVAGPRPLDDVKVVEEPPTIAFVADTKGDYGGGGGGKYPSDYGYGGGYKKPNFEYPSLCERFKTKCRSLGDKIGHFFHRAGHKIGAFFHKIGAKLKEEWAKCKSDHERFKYWWHCKKAEFKRYMYLRKQLALDRKIKLAEYRVEKLKSFLKYCHEERDQYAYKAKQCAHDYPDDKEPYPDYGCDKKEPVYTPPEKCPKAGDPEPYK
jgi:hypothetical protein